MSVNETDLEQLETYLDDELSSEEALELDRRLATDSALADQLNQLRAQRGLRVAMFHAMEPSDGEVESLLKRVDGVLHRQVDWSKRLSRLRYIGSAAACLFIGFMISHAIWPATPHDEINTAPPHVAQPAVSSGQGQIYQVVLQDETGNVIGVQNFDNINEAREFQSDVGQLQNKHRQIQNGIRLIRDKF
jgi:anti-sigma factor RsiW